MPKTDPLKHAKEAWGQEHNPFPPASIAGEESQDAPYDSQLLEEDRDQFIQKLIVKGILPPGREFGYLWSEAPNAAPGDGQPRLMPAPRKEPDRDCGKPKAS